MMSIVSCFEFFNNAYFVLIRAPPEPFFSLNEFILGGFVDDDLF